MKLQILKWTCIGLLIRLILMPFTMHGQDLFFINYFPMKFVQEGVWDPYGFISANLSYFPTTYYGPVLFFIMASANFIFIRVFKAAALVKLLAAAGPMMGREFTTFDYVLKFSGAELFKGLFIMKTPYLIFDFLIGIILLRLADSQKGALFSYSIWMLNIVVLHTTYAVGQADIITAFFIVAALYAAVCRQPYFSVSFLALGGATKLFPYMLIPPTCLLLGQGWKKRCLLLAFAAVVSTSVYLPFWLSSGNSVLGFFMSAEATGVHYPGIMRFALTAVFAVLYFIILVYAIKDSSSGKSGKTLLYYFIVILFLTYTAAPVRFRYLVGITPLLALVIPQDKRFGLFVLMIIVMMAFMWLTERDQQLGLFAPINPSYLNLPAFQEILGRFTPIELIYKIASRVLLLSFFISAWWTWRIKGKLA